jgi:hypothetical protein
MIHIKKLGKIYDKNNLTHTWKTNKDDLCLFWQENHNNMFVTLKDSCYSREMHMSIDLVDFFRIAKSFVEEYENTIK